MKKLVVLLITFALCTSVFVGCGGEKDINVISRESGSGTRGAFEEILNMKESDLAKSATIQNKTSSVASAVSTNVNAIGYISMGAIDENVKVLDIDGIEATGENVINGTYSLQRPYMIATKKSSDLSGVAQDFLSFIMSSNAQDTITSEGFISTNSNAKAYETVKDSVTGKVKIAGSTSVDPLMDSLIGEYLKYQKDVEFEKNSAGSTSGITAASDGTADIGMSSRDIKSDELEKVDGVQLCGDGLAVIVSNDNTLTNLTMEQLTKIYKGEIKKFSEIV